jgi:hypothetical protein
MLTRCAIGGTLLLAWAAGLPAQAAPSGNGAKPYVKTGQAAEGGLPFNNKLDTAYIRKTYVDGDFELAIELIEDALKYGGPFSHQDSIFILKHLGVMHTAKYETREKGKRYLMELLNVEPTAKILDMYASDMIYMIFKNIQDEFEARNPHRLNPSGKRPDPTGGPHHPRKTRRYAWVGWTVGAAAVVGGTAIAVHLLEEADAGNTREHASNE